MRSSRPSKRVLINLISKYSDALKTVSKNSFEITVNSSTRELATIREFIQDKTREYGVEQPVIDSIILAVDEASTNIVKHAYHFAENKEIRVTVSFENGNCTITLVDYGDAFDPDKVPNPDMNEYLKQRRVGGLGLMLIRTLMDFVEYQSIRGKFNKLTMMKRFS